MQAHRFRVLHPQMPQPTNARDHDPLARPGLGFFDALVILIRIKNRS
jgi:hypothetical protein